MDRCIKTLLEEARRVGASDVLLKEDQRALFRIKGKIYDSDFFTNKNEIERFTTLLQPAGFVSEYLGGGSSMDVSFEHEGRYRANCFTAMGKRCAVIRVIKDDILPLESLGLPSNLVERIQTKKGLSLIVGKTGAGKTTTLAALTKGILDTENAHIITLEDPVEYRFKGERGEITQRELGADFGSFDQGITEALRQSPDYLIIGEIRTLSALKAAISASEAGHGILGTLHSVGAARTLTRMLSMFSLQEKEFIRYQLAQNLNFILSQKLSFSKIKTELDFELLLNLPSIENTIREGRFNQLDNLILLGERQGMRSFKNP